MCPHDVPAIADHLDGRVLANCQPPHGNHELSSESASLRLPILTITSFSEMPPFMVGCTILSSVISVCATVLAPLRHPLIPAGEPAFNFSRKQMQKSLRGPLGPD